MKPANVRRLAAVILALAASPATAGKGLDDPSGRVAYIGAAATFGTRLYEGLDPEGSLMPLVIVEYADFYLHGTKAGYRIVRHGAASLAIQAEYTADGYRPRESDALEGMNRRKATLEVGVVASYQFSQSRLELAWSRDSLRVHKGETVSLRYERTAFSTPASMTAFHFSAVYYDAAKADYYFGVRNTETRSQRAAYVQEAVAGAGLGLTHTRILTQRMSAVAGVEVHAWDRGLERSPVVARTTELKGYLGFVFSI